MFCNQCEQTSKGKACTRLGICGKNEAVAIQQDKLVWQLRELAAVALMALGVKNIRLGPTLPAFVSPNILKVLVEQWNIMPVTTPDEDLKAILG